MKVKSLSGAVVPQNSKECAKAPGTRRMADVAWSPPKEDDDGNRACRGFTAFAILSTGKFKG